MQNNSSTTLGGDFTTLLTTEQARFATAVPFKLPEQNVNQLRSTVERVSKAEKPTDVDLMQSAFFEVLLNKDNPQAGVPLLKRLIALSVVHLAKLEEKPAGLALLGEMPVAPAAGTAVEFDLAKVDYEKLPPEVKRRIVDQVRTSIKDENKSEARDLRLAFAFIKSEAAKLTGDTSLLNDALEMASERADALLG